MRSRQLLPATVCIVETCMKFIKLPFSGHAATCRGSCRKSCILALLAPGLLMFEDSKIACI